MTYLVTGAAGFIGYHVADRLLTDGHEVVGIDNLNAYYDVELKQARLGRLEGRTGFRFLKLDIGDAAAVQGLFGSTRFERVIHLAAQAGVRYSLLHPETYAHANLVGHLNILEGCRHTRVSHFVYASSSSVYGLNSKVPFSEADPADHPVSLYAATKRAGELMAYTYNHLYGLATTGLRFFTVYGPWGRPDMAYFKFAEAIMEGRPVEVYGGSEQRRDFTYIDDVVEAVIRVASLSPASSTVLGPSPYRIYNVGNQTPVTLPEFVEVLEQSLGHTAIRRDVGAQPGDVLVTYADTSALARAVGFRPTTPLSEGLRRFADWFLEYRARLAR